MYNSFFLTKVCKTPGEEPNRDQTSDGEIIMFTCDLMDSLHGDDTVKCGTNGEGWLNSFPNCSKYYNVKKNLSYNAELC